MRWALFLVLFPAFFTFANAEEARVPSRVFEKIDRRIRNEPDYKSTPKYCLLLLGAGGEAKVWMVEDDRQLYVDKNANGDLTDDGPPVEPSEVRSIGMERWDFNYLVDVITTGDGQRHTDFNLRRWNYGEATDSYGLSLTLYGKRTKGASVKLDLPVAEKLTPATNPEIPMYAGWFGTFWSTEPETAPVIHFGGPLTPRMLRGRDFVIGSGQRRLSMGLMNPGSGRGAESRLSIEAIPVDVTPRLVIDWPSKDGAPSLQTSRDLTERCCYWEFYTTKFAVPEGVGVGVARVTVQFPGYELPLELTTTTIEAPVVEAPNSP